MLKSAFIASLAFTVSAARAQTQYAKPTPAEPASKTMSTPEPRANSFIESQARSRTEWRGMDTPNFG